MGCRASSQVHENNAGFRILPSEMFFKKYRLGGLLRGPNLDPTWYPENRLPLHDRGSFANVRACHSNFSGRCIAVKVVDCDLQSKSIEQERAHHDLNNLALREAQAWRAIGKHESCVELYAAYVGVRYWYFTMELGGPSLMKAFAKATEVSEACIKQLSIGMLKGIEHVHRCGFVHRDIKPQNFILQYGSKLESNPIVKLADFGFAIRNTPDLEGITCLCQATPYMAPELLCGEHYDEKADMWSFGVTLYLILFGKFPYTPCAVQPKEIPSYVAIGRKPQPSQSFLQLVNHVMAKESQQRLSATKAMLMLQAVDLQESGSRCFAAAVHNALHEIAAKEQSTPTDSPHSLFQSGLTCAREPEEVSEPSTPGTIDNIADLYYVATLLTVSVNLTTNFSSAASTSSTASTASGTSRASEASTIDGSWMCSARSDCALESHDESPLVMDRLRYLHQ